MNLVKCNNGHYYDGDKFDSCPHCKGAAGTETVKTVAMDQPTGEPSVTVSQTEPIEKTVPEVSVSLQKNLDAVKKTVNDTEKTVAFSFLDTKIEPVVGWLVCVEGEEIGKSYNLKSGKNFIGRTSLVNDIVIEGDKAVSREKHAIIIYDPKSRRFLAQPGMSSELYYINEDVVLQAMPLASKSIIQIGNTKLLFVPLCGEDFSWEDYAKEDK